MKTRVLIVPLFLLTLLGSGCANRLSSTTAPAYSRKVTPVSSIGVAGPGASIAFPALIERGYKVQDVGAGSESALELAKTRNIPFVAFVDKAGTDGAWWDGMFDFAMRVTDAKTGDIVWSANAEYGGHGLTINQVKSTKKALKDMIDKFAEFFPPQ
jgi:hypothetical protein